ncbi:MAG: hypothetical protein F6K41_39580 [Symploca sp. SIO3E6]|nr:hypothetical protein [Caldora sp. SIO3E6]
MELEWRYRSICQRLAELSDFTEAELKRSRQLFHLADTQIIPRHFEVWTCLVGLPLPEQLTQNFQTIVQQITEQLPATTRFYSVLPQNYHWEVFIIKRPQETFEPEYLQQIRLSRTYGENSVISDSFLENIFLSSFLCKEYRNDNLSLSP